MLWVVQNNLYNEYGYIAFLNALDRLESNYVIVKPVPFSDIILHPDFDSMTEDAETAEEPYIDTDQNIVICGAITLGKIAQARGWTPGTFLNENFDYKMWSAGFGNENLLNANAVICPLKEAECPGAEIFLRPTKDTKAFTGCVMDKEEFYSWKKSIMDLVDIHEGEDKDFIPLHSETEIMLSPVKPILAEYRLFVVQGKIVTGSVYKQGSMGISQLHKINATLMPDETVLKMAQRMIDRWQPADAFVVDSPAANS